MPDFQHLMLFIGFGVKLALTDSPSDIQHPTIT